MSEEKHISKKDNKGFLLGLLSGIAGLAAIGMVVFGVLYFTKSGADNNQAADNQPTAQADKQQPKVEFNISDSDHVLGNPNAKVKIFEFSDLQCPYCNRFHGVMHKIVKEYPNDVAWVYRQFPIASHPLGMPGAIATECAAEQGKFWEMADKIFENQQELTKDSFEKFAADLGLDIDKFKTCAADNPYADKIQNDYQMGIQVGVRGTPTSFVNGQMVPGAVPYESMQKMVEDLLKK